LAQARRDVVAWLEHERTAGRLDPSRTVLAGFSQGAMLSLDVALEWPPPLAGVGLLSGGPVDESRWRRRLAAGSVPPIWISHGRQDPMLRFDATERLVDALRQADAHVEFVAFDGGHTILPSVEDGFARWLAQRIP
jgi:phospholipase/carboxylesterase